MRGGGQIDRRTLLQFAVITFGVCVCVCTCVCACTALALSSSSASLETERERERDAAAVAANETEADVLQRANGASNGNKKQHKKKS